MLFPLCVKSRSDISQQSEVTCIYSRVKGAPSIDAWALVFVSGVSVSIGRPGSTSFHAFSLVVFFCTRCTGGKKVRRGEIPNLNGVEGKGRE